MGDPLFTVCSHEYDSATHPLYEKVFALIENMHPISILMYGILSSLLLLVTIALLGLHQLT